MPTTTNDVGTHRPPERWPPDQGVILRRIEPHVAWVALVLGVLVVLLLGSICAIMCRAARQAHEDAQDIQRR